MKVACSPCLALSLDTSASSSMYIQRYTWALVRLIGRKLVIGVNVSLFHPRRLAACPECTPSLALWQHG